MADIGEEQFRACSPDGSTAVMTADARIGAEAWGAIARIHGLTGDRSLPVAMQDRLIAEADALAPGNPYDVHTLDTSHSGPGGDSAKARTAWWPGCQAVPVALYAPHPSGEQAESAMHDPYPGQEPLVRLP